MAKKPGNLSDMRERAAKAGAAVGASTAAAEPKPPFNPARFAKEVRAEARKITWPSRKETWITSVMVFIMVVVASLFFWGVDTVLSFVISQILNLAQ